MFRKLIPILLILALSLTACDFHIILPITTITPGPTVTDPINVPLPAEAGKTTDLSLEFGAGTLKLNPGAGTLVSGTATYNVADFKPEVTATGNTVDIKQGNWKFNGIPDMSNIKNEWDLQLGSAPINLTIKAGAYKAEYQFGGLSLTNLTVKDGASETRLDFASPNQAEMALLRYETGASSVTLTGLGNANFASLEFSSGAGNYSLDFSGQLKRNGSVHIETGLSNLTLVIPADIPVQITIAGGLLNVTPGPGWVKNGNVYTQPGSGPQLTIIIRMGAGSLTITR
jgi:hypothetical protein